MTKAAVPEGEFIELVRQYGISGTSKRTGVGVREIFRRRKGIEQKRGISISAPDNRSVRPSALLNIPSASPSKSATALL